MQTEKPSKQQGNFITAVALSKATAAGDVIKIQIVKAGYKPAAK